LGAAAFLVAAGRLEAADVVATAAPSPAEAVATVDGKPITAAELEDAVGYRLLGLRTEEFNAKLKILHQIIGERLLAREAAARKVSVDDLVQAEVQGKVAAVTEADVNKAYETLKERRKDKPEAELRKLIEENLKQQRSQTRRNEFLRELRDKGDVRLLLDPPRVSVRDGGDPSQGPKDAPVTIVEFSDFQCPYCARMAPTFKRLHEAYGDKIRVVFRNFPLTIHPQASKAAEAAACANDQGKFWEMHDKLFADQQKLQLADLKATAAAIGLDAQAFAECLDSGKHEPTWKADGADGQRYGVSGTPAFFVNGRLISGSQPYEAFAQVIDDELQRKGLAKSH